MPACMLIAAWLLTAASLTAGDEPATSDQNALSRRRLDAMQSAIDDFTVVSKDFDVSSGLKFGSRPLLRYDDQTRGLLDAGVWRLGQTGRPSALVTLEIYRSNEGHGKLTYEFVSLSPSRFSIASPRGVQWAPAATDLKMAVLPDAPRPADSPKSRLVQIREMARRFSAYEVSGGSRVECRLLPQPIDRYAAPDELLDGAVFVFANGTNPEVGLILECSGANWSYGIFRLSSARLFAELDGQQVFAAPWFNKYSVSSPYTAAGHAISPLE